MAVEDGILDALTLLAAIIIAQTENIAAEGDDGDKVASCEQRHAKVAKTPDHFECGQGTKHDEDTSREDAENVDHRFILREETDIGLTIIIIADDAAKGEEQDGHRNEYRTK